MNPTAKIKNFTPLLDDLVKDYGIVTAAVWGRVWRYAQQKNKVCQASTEKIGNELGMNRRTVIRHIKILVESGYIKDHTPGIRNRPHTYSITKKAFIEIIIEAKNGMTESHTYNEEVGQRVTAGVTESPNRCDRESHEDTNKKQDKKQSNTMKDYYFEIHNRKRWSNKKQEEYFYQMADDFGEELLTKAIDWAAIKNISDLSRIRAAAETIQKNKGSQKVMVNPDGSLVGI